LKRGGNHFGVVIAWQWSLSKPAATVVSVLSLILFGGCALAALQLFEFADAMTAAVAESLGLGQGTLFHRLKNAAMPFLRIGFG